MSPARHDPASKNTPPAVWRSRLCWLGKKLLPLGAFLVAITLLITLIGVAQRFGWIPNAGGGEESQARAGNTVFTCPMHPQIRQPSPGRCPICGMELVPASSAGADLDELAVKIAPAQRRLANIQTSPVQSGKLAATIDTVGAIAVDESRQSTIAAYIDGRLERLFADYTGVQIQRGDHLAVIYSPQLYSAQVEYLEARRALQATAGVPAVRQAQEALANNTRQRLREFGMTDEQLAELERSGAAQSRLTIYSPQAGTVVEKLAVEGDYVKAGDPIYRIAELSTVWLMLKLFPEDATRVRFGQRVDAEVQSLPGETFVGRVAFIDPTVNPATRTVGVRVELLNEHQRLRPGDYAAAQLRLPLASLGQVFDQDLAGKWISPMHPQIIRDEPGQCPICGMDLVPTSQYGFTAEPLSQPESLYVPRSAVLLAGGNSLVYVETEPGRFEIRPVTIGSILEDKIMILAGLRAGEIVATSGNFLIDSQMQLAGKPSLIDPTRAIANAKSPDGPMTFEKYSVAAIAGGAGVRLESMYTAYFDIQRALAADKTPSESAAKSLHQAAAELSRNTSLPAAAVEQLQQIAARSEHLHHHDLTTARLEFKPLSHAVLALATQVRGESATSSFTHFYCPMVPEGGGDWLQANDALLNPYFGSEMLRCGERVEVIPALGGPGDAAPRGEMAPTKEAN